MSFCPFMSKPDGINHSTDKLYPCITTCALYSNRECSLKTLADALKNSTKTINEQYHK